MNINLSLPLVVNRQGFADSSLPLKDNLDRPDSASSRTVISVGKEQQNAAQARGLAEADQRVIPVRDRIDLRVLRDQSISLIHQKAVSAYEVSSAITENSLTSNYLDIRV